MWGGVCLLGSARASRAVVRATPTIFFSVNKRSISARHRNEHARRVRSPAKRRRQTRAELQPTLHQPVSR
jgi:hypothetical protein